MDDEWGTAPCIDAGRVRLRDVLRPRKTVIDYTYDFGDCWEHRLTVTDVRY
jgi:Plasmid pRiA4b ORF-3-like protein